MLIRVITGVTASHMSQLCTPYDIKPMRDHKTGNIGVITTNENKENAVLLVQSAINSRSFSLAKNVFSVGETTWKGEDGMSDEDRFFKRANELVYQMSRFQKQVKPIVDGFSKEKVVYSGKTSSEQDDLCMCLLIGVYFVQKYINSL